MSRTGAWLTAFRLRTLPLSFSSIILGSLLAYHNGYFETAVLVFALLTTLFLQILSNLANDYGDTIHGVDNHLRVGPMRSVQSGSITLTQMKAGIILFTLLSLASGVWLLVKGTKGLDLSSGLILLVVGILAIAAAIKYTIGKNGLCTSGSAQFVPTPAGFLAAAKLGSAPHPAIPPPQRAGSIHRPRKKRG